MMKSIQNSSKLVVLVLILLVASSGCKSKKKAMEASNAAAERDRIEQETARKKQEQEDERLRKEAEESARIQAEKDAQLKREADAKASAPSARLGQYFDAIANAGSVASANSSIAEALTLFASQDTPVLIIISESGGQKDYDKPTTIKTYLNYLKDQKKNINRIDNLEFDGSGKINALELRKK